PGWTPITFKLSKTVLTAGTDGQVVVTNAPISYFSNSGARTFVLTDAAVSSLSMVSETPGVAGAPYTVFVTLQNQGQASAQLSASIQTYVGSFVWNSWNATTGVLAPGAKQSYSFSSVIGSFSGSFEDHVTATV